MFAYLKLCDNNWKQILGSEKVFKVNIRIQKDLCDVMCLVRVPGNIFKLINKEEYLLEKLKE